jgi:GDP-L-fucose synthase
MNNPHPDELARLRDGKIYVAGHRGMVGSALVRRLEKAGCENLLVRTRKDLDLTDSHQVNDFFSTEKPDYVFLAAAKVGGINANNTYPAEFIYDNLMIAANIINAAHATNARRLLFLGSSCIYPRLAKQPMAEDCLLSGPLEPTNEPYAMAKIAGIKLCESYNRQYHTDFRSVMPTNLYGPNDNFDLETSHVLAALIRKFYEAKVSGAATVEVWGTGKPRREFLHVDDLADASLFVMSLPVDTYAGATRPMLSHLNVGTGTDVSIGELAEIVKTSVGYEGAIKYNTDYPDGMPRKLLNGAALSALGWTATIDLHAGIQATYDWYRKLDHVG